MKLEYNKKRNKELSNRRIVVPKRQFTKKELSLLLDCK